MLYHAGFQYHKHSIPIHSSPYHVTYTYICTCMPILASLNYTCTHVLHARILTACTCVHVLLYGDIHEFQTSSFLGRVLSRPTTSVPDCRSHGTYTQQDSPYTKLLHERKPYMGMPALRANFLFAGHTTKCLQTSPNTHTYPHYVTYPLSVSHSLIHTHTHTHRQTSPKYRERVSCR